MYDPLLRERANNMHLTKELRFGIQRILGVQIPETSESTEDTLPRNSRKYCSICNPKLKRKTSYLCTKWQKTNMFTMQQKNMSEMSKRT